MQIAAGINCWLIMSLENICIINILSTIRACVWLKAHRKYEVGAHHNVSKECDEYYFII